MHGPVAHAYHPGDHGGKPAVAHQGGYAGVVDEDGDESGGEADAEIDDGGGGEVAVDQEREGPEFTDPAEDFGDEEEWQGGTSW